MRDQTLRQRAERGQVMVLIALAFVGLAAFIGLAVDAGILFANVGNLRRATDAAALAAANQYREGWDPPDLSAEALEMLDLNGIDGGTATAWVCDLSNFPGAPLFSAYHDAALCPGGNYPFSSSDGSPRKVVRVDAQMDVNFAFLPIIGFDSTTIHANAQSEAASIDLVLALDVSDSMSIDLCYDDPEDNDNDGTIDECSETTGPGTEGMDGTFDDDVPLCSTFQSSPWPLIPPGVEPAAPDAPTNACWPFEDVRYAAHKLVERMYFPYDRLSIVTFGRTPQIWLELDDTDSLPSVCIGLENDPKRCAHKVLDGIQVEPSPLGDPLLCEGTTPRGCMSTNIGDGLVQAGARFCVDEGPPFNGDCDREEMREEAVWIVLLLTDGAANAAIGGGNPAVFADWICPDTTYPPTSTLSPWCRDDSAATRHASGESGYDADDYARDQADNVGCPGPGTDPPPGCPAGGGVGSVIFAIGLGKNVTENPEDLYEPRAGEFLLRYIADVGTDGQPNNDPDCSPDPGIGEDCGNYYFAPEGDDLISVFEDIASRIFTRITH